MVRSLKQEEQKKVPLALYFICCPFLPKRVNECKKQNDLYEVFRILIVKCRNDLFRLYTKGEGKEE